MQVRIYLLIMLFVGLLTACSIGAVGELEADGYTHHSDGLHYALVTLQDNEVAMDELKANISAFNRDHGYTSPDLRLSNIFLGDTEEDRQPLITVRRFEDYDAAKKYARSLQRQLKREIPNLQSVLPISQDNYRHLLRSKDLAAYYRFSGAAG